MRAHRTVIHHIRNQPNANRASITSGLNCDLAFVIHHTSSPAYNGSANEEAKYHFRITARGNVVGNNSTIKLAMFISTIKRTIRCETVGIIEGFNKVGSSHLLRTEVDIFAFQLGGLNASWLHTLDKATAI